MYKINNHIRNETFEGLKVKVLEKNENMEIISISLEKGTLFPEHTSPTDAHLIVLEGELDFHINQNQFHLTTQQHFNFPAGEKHWVKANKNSKFLIIR